MLLDHLPILFLDCQTTGLSRNAEPIEMGWSLSTESDEIHTRLLKPEDVSAISNTVWEMTGLRPEALETGVAPHEAWKEIVSKSSSVHCAIIHYAQFEKPILQKLHQLNEGTPELPWEIICTQRIARRLCPNFPSHTIRALSGYLGYLLPETHRAYENVVATQKIWKYLVETFKEKESIHSFKEFQEWLKTKPTPRPKKAKTARTYLMEKERRLLIPKGPGIYQMKAADGTILYVGKATDLRSRVNSYFRTRNSERKMLGELLTQVSDIQVTPTKTPLEAALLELDRIKELEPRYNTSLLPRAVCPLYFSFDLERYQSSPDSEFPWGPFFSESSFESTEILWQLKNKNFDAINPNHVNHPLEELEQVLLKRLASIDTSLTTNQIETLERIDLLRMGKRLGPITAPSDPLEASIHRKLRRSPNAIHHAHWLVWLTESRVFWKLPVPNSIWRSLKIEGGQIIEACDVELIPSLSTFCRRRVPFRERQKKMDRTVFDRMRVLLSELSTLKRRGASVVIQFSTTRSYEPQGADELVGLFHRGLEVTEDPLDDENETSLERAEKIPSGHGETIGGKVDL